MDFFFLFFIFSRFCGFARLLARVGSSDLGADRVLMLTIRWIALLASLGFRLWMPSKVFPPGLLCGQIAF